MTQQTRADNLALRRQQLAETKAKRQEHTQHLLTRIARLEMSISVARLNRDEAYVDMLVLRLGRVRRELQALGAS